MNKFLKLPMLLILVSLIVSCNKSNDDENCREYKYHSIDNGLIRMFTKTGEVNDQLVINKFIKSFNDNYQGSTFPHNDTEYYKTFEVNFNIISKTKAQVIYNQSKIVDAKINYIDGVAYIAENDTLQIPGKLYKCGQLKCMPEVISEIIIPFSVGGVITKILRTNYVIFENNELHIPIISFIEKKYSDNKLIWKSHGMNYQNIFDQNYLKSKEFSDTIVIEERNIIYK